MNETVPEADFSRHYLTATVASLAQTGVSQDQMTIFRILIPSLAYTSSRVRHGMLALAAMHKYLTSDTSSEEQSKDQYLQAGHHHGRIFVSSSAAEMQKLKPEYLDEDLACSLLLTVLAFAWFRVRRSEGSRLTDHKAWNWLHMLLGTRTLCNHIDRCDYQQSGGSVARPLMTPSYSPSCPSAENLGEDQPLNPHQLIILHTIQTSQPVWSVNLTAALQSHAHTCKLTHCQLQALHAAIQDLNVSTIHLDPTTIPNAGPFQLLTSWPTRVSKPVVEMLTGCDKFALVVYAHWLMFIVLARNTWWIGDMGAAGIRQVLFLLKGEDEEMMALMEWPRKVLCLEGLLNDR